MAPTGHGRQRKPLSPQHQQVFKEVLDRTGKVKDAASAINVSLVTAYKLAKEFGWSSKGSGPQSAYGPQRRYTSAERQQVLALYDRLASIAEVSHQTGVKYGKCRSWLMEAGLKSVQDFQPRRQEFWKLLD